MANQPLLRNWPRKLPNSAKYRKVMPIKVSRSFMVTDFGTNRKPICNFLLVINTNLPPILHLFQVMTDHWIFAVDMGVRFYTENGRFAFLSPPPPTILLVTKLG